MPRSAKQELSTSRRLNQRVKKPMKPGRLEATSNLFVSTGAITIEPEDHQATRIDGLAVKRCHRHRRPVVLHASPHMRKPRTIDIAQAARWSSSPSGAHFITSVQKARHARGRPGGELRGLGKSEIPTNLAVPRVERDPQM